MSAIQVGYETLTSIAPVLSDSIGYAFNCAQYRGGNTILKSVATDYKNAGILGKLAVPTALAGQIIDRSYIAVAAIAAYGTTVMAETQSPILTGLAVALPVFGSQALVGGSLVEAMQTGDETVHAIGEMYPGVLEVAKVYAPATRRTPLTLLREAASGFAIGTSSFVLAEKTARPETSRKKQHITSARISALAAVASFGVAAGIEQAYEHLPANYTDNLVGVLGKSWTYLAAAAIWETPRFIKHARARKKSKNAQPEISEAQA